MALNPIPGVSKEPYIEVTNHEETKSRQWAKALAYLGFASIAIVGVKWTGTNLKFQMDPEKLSYLSRGFNVPGMSSWQEVAGLEKLADGTYNVPAKFLALEAVKRVEEAGGSILRTLGTADFFSRQIFSEPTSSFKLTPDLIKGAESHYEKTVLEREMTPFEKMHGFQTAQVQEAHLVDYLDRQYQAKGTFMGHAALEAEVKAKIASGEFNPDKLPGFFNLDEKGHLDRLQVPDVDVYPRRWAPHIDGDPIDPVTGQPKGQHIFRQGEALTSIGGGDPIHHSNKANFIVSKAKKTIDPSRTAKELGEAFGINIDDTVKTVNDRLGPTAKKAIVGAEVQGRTWSRRYFKLLDNPAEALLEGLGREPGSATNSGKYSGLKNLFGTGGDYSGSTMDMWAKHAGRIIPLAIGAAAVYEVGSRITKAFTGDSLAQIGGKAVAATQRTYAGVSDITGLTGLNKTQEEKAEGSHRLMGVLAFPMAGYLTGRVAASAVNPVVAESAQIPWQAAREEVHELPKILQLSDQKLPIVGNLSEKMTRGHKFGLMGLAVGAAMSAPFLLGALGSNHSYQEVKAEQSGETEVAVKKARMWEMGRSDVGGEETSYYRPGWFKRLMDNPGAELEDGGHSDEPITRALRSLVDPYWKEKLNFYDRPYPVTSADTSSGGPLGSIWGLTIGRVLKPTKMMHADEISEGGVSDARQGITIQYGKNASKAPSESLGGTGPTPATLPSDPTYLLQDTVFKAKQAIGLPGFVIGAIAKKVTGESDFGSDQQVLASASSIGSFRDKFWDLGVGGAATLSEGVRRFMPKPRADIQEINPVSNNMPDWMPGASNYLDFQRGDPYAAVAEGEYRLPGSGFERRFEELKGVDPADYPDIFKYKILGDVAPFSKEFEGLSKKVATQAQSGEMSERDFQIYQGTKAQLEEKRHKIHFRNEPDSIAGKYWGAITSLGRENPVEHLLPVSPVHKFAGPVDAISEYEDREVYSTRNPSWDAPYNDFIKPAGNMAAKLLGWEGIPQETQDKRDLTGYFDKLEYVKDKRLEANYRDQGNGQAAHAYARKAQYTMYGADPYSDLATIEKILPSVERPFFEEFLGAKTDEDKGRILKLVPSYIKKFYTAQWQKQIYAALAAKGNLNSDELQAAKSIEASRALEGQVADRGMWNEYTSKVDSGEVRKNTFPDYIRAKNLDSYYEEESPFGLPSADWIGYDSNVDLDMVKLRVVQNTAGDFHDHQLWESDVTAAERMPYLEPAAEQLIGSHRGREDVVKSLTSMRMNDLSVDTTSVMGKNRITIDVNADRKGDINKQLKRAGVI